MAKYIDKNGNITFNSVQTNNFLGVGQLISHPDLSGASDADLEDIANENGGKLPSKVNVVEIDWNEANLGYFVTIRDNGSTVNGNPAEINTTGALLSYISALAQRIDNIESVLLQLGQ